MGREEEKEGEREREGGRERGGRGKDRKGVREGRKIEALTLHRSPLSFHSNLVSAT